MSETERVVQAGEIRSAQIESLRAIAALAVVVSHAFSFSFGIRRGLLGSYLDHVLFHGGMGVLMFFALSGYLLYWPFARRDFGSGDPVDVGTYARNRALRILPLYYVVIVFLLIVQEGGGTAEQWWRFMLFAQNFSSETFSTVDGPAWSLVPELHFYLALPLLAWAVGRWSAGSARRAAVILGGIGLASLAFRVATLDRFGFALSQPWRHSTLAMFGFFVPGMLLALLRARWSESRPAWVRGRLARADLWLLASLAPWVIVFADYSYEALVGVAMFLAIGACVLPLERGPLVRALGWKPLAWIGVISYSVYLLHIPLMTVLRDRTAAETKFWWMLGSALVVTIAASALTYRFVEAPFLRRRGRWARGTAPKLGDRATEGEAAEAPAPGLTPTSRS